MGIFGALALCVCAASGAVEVQLQTAELTLRFFFGSGRLCFQEGKWGWIDVDALGPSFGLQELIHPPESPCLLRMLMQEPVCAETSNVDEVLKQGPIFVK